MMIKRMRVLKKWKDSCKDRCAFRYVIDRSSKNDKSSNNDVNKKTFFDREDSNS